MTVLDDVRQFLKKKVGLDVDGVRDEQLERRIANYCRRHRVAEGDLIGTLSDEATLDLFLDSLTINVTSLFRNAERWKKIEEILSSLGPRPELWSAACSKGAEPYTMAIIADRLKIKPNIWATDIDTRILAAAVEGVYTAAEVKEVPRDVLKTYLNEVDGSYHVDRKVASMVKFDRQDLLSGPMPRKKFDLIACRNVAIYFSQDAKRLLHSNLAGCLKPGGYLFIGFEIRLNPDVQLPGARSAIILRMLGERAELVSTNPDRQAIEAGKATSFVVELAGDGAAAAVVDVTQMADVASCEPVAAPAASGPAAGGGGAPATRATVRVEVERLDDLMDLVSELVVGRGLLDEHSSRLNDRDLGEALAQVHRTISDLQAMVAKVRMISLEKTFARLTRIVRDTARDVNKPVKFVTSGEDTELDRSMVDEVADPLMHLLRNSVDHGVEDPEARSAAGKSEEGEVTLRAFSEGNQVVIEVKDDGGGIDADRVCAKAVERGVITADEAAQMTREQKIDLVFAAGLSTRDEASKISGRGVGMDVVRTAATKLGGHVAVESTTGVGTVFTIRLPLSLAVTEALLVKVCDETWAIPIDQVEETMHIRVEDQRSVGGVPVIDLRGEVVSVVHSREMMYSEYVGESGLSAVVFRYKGRRVALTVDELVGRSEVVVKPLPSDLTEIELASSVTILGDGSVGLILDVSAVADLSRQRSSAFG